MKRSVICFASAFLLVLLGWMYWHSTVRQSFAKEVLRWKNDDVELEGTLYLPSSDGQHPCIVFIHGSGTLSRTGRSGKMFREHAERLSSQGVAVLIYDKRGCGNSSGDWRDANLDDLCEDALGGVAKLRDRADIDSSKIGLLGCSQGGWVVLLAAEKDPRIAFLITLSGPTISPAAQGHYVIEAQMKKNGQTEKDVQAALKLNRQITDVYRTDSGWETAEQALRNVEYELWFEYAGIGLQRKTYWNWKWFRDLPLDTDPLPLLGKLNIPLLAAHGENDGLVPADRSAATIDEFAKQGKPFTAIVFPDSGHAVDREISKTWTPPANYWTELVQWLVREEIIDR